MSNIPRLDEPLNADERMLYGINVRLDAMIHMLSSFISVYAENNKVSTTSNKVVNEVKPKKVTAKSTVVKESVIKEIPVEIVDEVKPKKVTAKATTKK